MKLPDGWLQKPPPVCCPESPRRHTHTPTHTHTHTHTPTHTHTHTHTTCSNTVVPGLSMLSHCSAAWYLACVFIRVIVLVCIMCEFIRVIVLVCIMCVCVCVCVCVMCVFIRVIVLVCIMCVCWITVGAGEG